MSRRILSSLIILAIAIPCLAQETTATLLGTATVPSGAVLPNVTVRVTNLATNTSRETRNDTSGTYSLPFLPAGDYAVTATMAWCHAQKEYIVTPHVQQAARLDF